jgi:hypothetical protein
MADYVKMRATHNHELLIRVPADSVEYREGLGWEVDPDQSNDDSRDSSPSRLRKSGTADKSPAEE